MSTFGSKKFFVWSVIVVVSIVTVGSVYLFLRPVLFSTVGTQYLQDLSSQNKIVGLAPDLAPVGTYHEVINSKSDDEDFTRMQIRGTVVEWKGDRALIQTQDGKTVEVSFTQAVQYACLPAMMDSADGRGKIPMEQAYVNLMYQDGLGESKPLREVQGLAVKGQSVLILGIQEADREIQGYVLVRFKC